MESKMKEATVTSRRAVCSIRIGHQDRCYRSHLRKCHVARVDVEIRSILASHGDSGILVWTMETLHGLPLDHGFMVRTT